MKGATETDPISKVDLAGTMEDDRSLKVNLFTDSNFHSFTDPYFRLNRYEGTIGGKIDHER